MPRPGPPNVYSGGGPAAGLLGVSRPRNLGGRGWRWGWRGAAAAWGCRPGVKSAAGCRPVCWCRCAGPSSGGGGPPRARGGPAPPRPVGRPLGLQGASAGPPRHLLGLPAVARPGGPLSVPASLGCLRVSARLPGVFPAGVALLLRVAPASAPRSGPVALARCARLWPGVVPARRRMRLRGARSAAGSRPGLGPRARPRLFSVLRIRGLSLTSNR
jgi:hypothetical protein